ncbi:MAG: hypothetical protein ACYDHP_02120 [Ferrimicrobium sp.]
MSAATAWLKITPLSKHERLLLSHHYSRQTGAVGLPLWSCFTLLGVVTQDKALETQNDVINISPHTPVLFFTFSGIKSARWTPTTPLCYALVTGVVQGQPEAMGIRIRQHSGVSDVAVETKGRA